MDNNLLDEFGHGERFPAPLPGHGEQPESLIDLFDRASPLVDERQEEEQTDNRYFGLASDIGADASDGLFDFMGDKHSVDEPYFGELTDPFSGGSVNFDFLEFDAYQPLLQASRARGLNDSEIAAAGWKYKSSRGGTPLLLIPSRGQDRSLLSVRALEIFQLSSGSRPLAHYGQEAAEQAGLEIDDVPSPLYDGLFDGEVTWVTWDPVDALLLRSAGARATSLAHPCATLGSPEGLWQLRDLYALNGRTGPRGTLVIIDPTGQLDYRRGGLLKGLFRNVLHVPQLSFVVGDKDIADSKRSPGFWNALPTLDPSLNGLWSCIFPSIPLRPRLGLRAFSGPLEPLALVSVSDMREKASQDTEWLVKDFVSPAAITELQGVPKDGKSTLVLPMMAALSAGETFLDRECTPTPVIYVTEQSRRTGFTSLKRSLPVDREVPDYPNLHFLPIEKLYGRRWEHIITFLRQECKRLGARAVVFDTLSQVAGLQGDTEQSAGAARELFRSLRTLTFDGVGVVAVRHSRKMRGSIVETGLGSIAAAGEADHLVRITRVAGRSRIRRVESVGRLSDDLDVLVELTPSQEWILSDEVPPSQGSRAGGPTAVDKAKDFVREQLRKAGGGPVMRQALLNARKDGRPSEGSLDKALKALDRSEIISKPVDGARGGAVQFYLLSAPPEGDADE